MLFRNQFLKYMAPAIGDGAGEGAGGAGEPGDKVSDREAKLLRESMSRKEKIGQLEAQLKNFEGIDPERYRSMVAAAEKAEQEKRERENARLIEEGKFNEALESVRAESEGVLNQVRSQMSAELKSVSDERDSFKTKVEALTKQIEELTIGASFANSQFIRNELVQAMNPERNRRLHGDHFDLVEGKVVGFDKPRGEPGRSPLVDKDGQPVSFDEALKRILSAQPDYESMLRSHAKQGSGASPAGEKERKVHSDVQPGIGRIVAALGSENK